MLQALKALVIHERNQQGALHRALQAKHMGVENPERYATMYPGSTVTTNNTTNTTDGGSGWVKGALLGAALLTGGGGAAAGLARYLSPGTPAPVVAPAASEAKEAPGIEPTTGARTAVPQKPQAWDVVYEEKVKLPDGTWGWKVTKRERLKTDGR